MSTLSGQAVDDREVAVDGLTLRVRSTGTGRPVLLLHGFPDSLEMWDPITPALVAAGFRVIAPDQRGFGRSSAPGARRDYRADRIVLDAVAVLDALDVREPACVIGHDWGALIGWMLCLDHPERVHRYVTLSVGHPKAYASAGLEQKRKGLYVGFFHLAGLADRWIASRDLRWVGAFMPGHPDLNRVREDLRRPGRITAGLRWYRANVLTIFTRRWPSSTVPTLGIVGAADDYLTEGQMAASAKHMDADWRWESLPGANHWLTYERPERVAELAIAWLDEDRPPADRLS